MEILLVILHMHSGYVPGPFPGGGGGGGGGAWGRGYCILITCKLCIQYTCTYYDTHILSPGLCLFSHCGCAFGGICIPHLGCGS